VSLVLYVPFSAWRKRVRSKNARENEEEMAAADLDDADFECCDCSDDEEGN